MSEGCDVHGVTAADGSATHPTHSAACCCAAAKCAMNVFGSGDPRKCGPERSADDEAPAA
jgi:hypothetical protein